MDDTMIASDGISTFPIQNRDTKDRAALGQASVQCEIHAQ